ncbi:hypothetical protein D3C85_818680 [compost metagenome]
MFTKNELSIYLYRQMILCIERKSDPAYLKYYQHKFIALNGNTLISKLKSSELFIFTRNKLARVVKNLIK